MNLSPFKINVFTQCRRRYKFHYVDNLIRQYKRDWPWLTMGQHVHRTLFRLLDEFPPGKRDYDRASDILRKEWRKYRKGFKDAEEEREWGLKALDQLNRFFQFPDLNELPLRLEQHYEAPLEPNLSLNGRIDRLDKLSDNTLHVIDYKTGGISAEQDDFPLLLYCLLISRNFSYPVSKASYVFLESGSLHSISPSPHDIEVTLAQVKDVAKQIAVEAVFPASPSALCKYCDFAQICDARLQE